MRAALTTALAVFSASFVCWAQPRDEPRRRPPPPPPLEAFERILDEDQRAELREIFRANRERLREIDEQVRDGRRELHKSIFAKEVDEAELKEKIDQIAKLEAERQFMRLKALARIRPSLTEDQIERLKRLHERGPGMMRDFRGRPEGPREYRPEPRGESRSRERDHIAPPPPDEEGPKRYRRPEDFPDRRDTPPPSRRRPEPE